MTETFEQAVIAYQSGKTADVIQFYADGEWGAAFTVPHASSDVMEHIADQYRATGAARMRHIRRARLRNRLGKVREIAIETLLPEHHQRVFDLDAGEMIPVSYLRDDTLAVLERRMGIE